MSDPRAARPGRGHDSALLPLSVLPPPGRGAVGGDLCPKAGWPQSSVRVRAAKVESRGLGVPVFEGACPRERKCLPCPSGSYDRALLAFGQERGGGDRRPKGGLGWLSVAGTLQTLHRARSPTPTFLLDLCPAGSPLRPHVFPTALGWVLGSA